MNCSLRSRERLRVKGSLRSREGLHVKGSLRSREGLRVKGSLRSREGLRVKGSLRSRYLVGEVGGFDVGHGCPDGVADVGVQLLELVQEHLDLGAAAVFLERT